MYPAFQYERMATHLAPGIHVDAERNAVRSEVERWGHDGFELLQKEPTGGKGTLWQEDAADPYDCRGAAAGAVRPAAADACAAERAPAGGQEELASNQLSKPPPPLNKLIKKEPRQCVRYAQALLG